MNRWVWFVICTVLGLIALICGLLMPVHLRAVDASVIEQAGRGTPTIVEEGLSLVHESKLGPAQLLAEAAQAQKLPEQGKLADALNQQAKVYPERQLLGMSEPRLETFFKIDAGSTNPAVPITDFMVQEENRSRVLTEFLGSSQRPLVQELLRFRAVTNTAIFTPSASASGQALDTAICVCGLLVEQGEMPTGLNNKMLAAATGANGGGDSELFEQALLDVMSLGQRFNWGQLVTYISRLDNLEMLHAAAAGVRNGEGQIATLFAAAQLSGNPAAVGAYTMKFSQTGLKDLAWSLQYGVGGVTELLRRDRQVYHPTQMQQSTRMVPFAAFSNLVWHAPRAALALKWLLYLGSGFLLALAVHFARPLVSDLERPLQVRGFHMARELLFALGFLLAILLVSEPFLAQDSQSQKTESPFRIQLPMAGSLAAAVTGGPHGQFMNQLSLLTLLLFFVLQALLYSASLLKLAEIRRQQVPSRVKLKLLENEDHLFDAGLYLGFVGTIISLILVSLGVIKPSLMAAYSSTSFGILFVSAFKIFNLRPLRRKLLMDAETNPERAPAPTAPQFAAPL